MRLWIEALLPIAGTVAIIAFAGYMHRRDRKAILRAQETQEMDVL